MAPLSAATSRVWKEIELIRDYRTRLIADVVTGKVDVRRLAQETFEVGAEEPETWDEGQDFIDGEEADDLELVEELADADD